MRRLIPQAKQTSVQLRRGVALGGSGGHAPGARPSLEGTAAGQLSMCPWRPLRPRRRWRESARGSPWTARHVRRQVAPCRTRGSRAGTERRLALGRAAATQLTCARPPTRGLRASMQLRGGLTIQGAGQVRPPAWRLRSWRAQRRLGRAQRCVPFAQPLHTPRSPYPTQRRMCPSRKLSPYWQHTSTERPLSGPPFASSATWIPARREVPTTILPVLYPA